MAFIALAHYLPAQPGRRPVFAFSHLRSKASRGASALLYYSSQAGQGTLGPFMLGPSLGRPPEEVVGVVLCFMLESASIGHGQLPCPVLHQSQDTVSYPSDMMYVSRSLLRKALYSTHVSTDSVLLLLDLCYEESMSSCTLDTPYPPLENSHALFFDPWANVRSYIITNTEFESDLTTQKVTKARPPLAFHACHKR